MHNVFIRYYQFSKNVDKLIKIIVEVNNHKIFEAEIRYLKWLNKNKIKNHKIQISSIIIKFFEIYYINVIWRVELNWFIVDDNAHYDYQKYVRENRIIRCFRCQKPDHITFLCDLKIFTYVHYI